MPHQTKTWVIEKGLMLVIGLACLVFILTHQSKPVNTDVAWLVEVGKRWLHNGKYISDYYETNLPLAFYIYLPIYFLMAKLAFSLSMSFTLYYGLLAAVSLSLLSTCLTRDDVPLRVYVTILFVMILWFYYLPLFQMGQRDPLSSILVAPHIFYTLVRDKNKLSFSSFFRVLSLTFAIIGYMLKPYFILVWCFLFAWLWYSRRSFQRAMKQSQCLIFLIAGLIYLGVLIVYHPDFISRALPFVWDVYYPTILLDSRLELILLDSQFVFRGWLFAVFILLAFRELRGMIPHYAYPLMLLSSAYTLSYLVQGVGFSYQGIPALTFSSALACSIAIDAIREKIFILFLMLGVLSILISYKNNHFSTANFKKDMQDLKSVVSLIPDKQRVSLLHCENYTAYPVLADEKKQYPSIFPTMQQPCIAYVRYVFMHHPLKKAFEKLIHLMREDFLTHPPDYLIMVNDNTPIHRKELAIFDDIFMTPSTWPLWRQYKVVKQVGDYAIRKRTKKVKDRIWKN